MPTRLDGGYDGNDVVLKHAASTTPGIISSPLSSSSSLSSVQGYVSIGVRLCR